MFFIRPELTFDLEINAESTNYPFILLEWRLNAQTKGALPNYFKPTTQYFVANVVPGMSQISHEDNRWDRCYKSPARPLV